VGHAQAIAIQDLVLVAVDQAEHYWIAAEHTHAVDKQSSKHSATAHHHAPHKTPQQHAAEHAQAIAMQEVPLAVMHRREQ